MSPGSPWSNKSRTKAFVARNPLNGRTLGRTSICERERARMRFREPTVFLDSIQRQRKAGTPISGWPEAKVRIMAQNKSKGMAVARSWRLSFPCTLSPWSLSLPPICSHFWTPCSWTSPSCSLVGRENSWHYHHDARYRPLPCFTAGPQHPTWLAQSLLTTSDIEWVTFMKAFFLMIRVGRRSTWQTWSLSWQLRRTKHAMVAIMMSSLLKTVAGLLPRTTFRKKMNPKLINVAASPWRSSWRYSVAPSLVTSRLMCARSLR